MIEPDDLTDADEAILDELQDGARTRKALIDATGLHRNTVGNRLDVLSAGDVIECIHDTTALYELIEDPRYPAPDDVDLDELRDALADVREAYEAVDGDDLGDALERAEEILEGGDLDA